LLIRKHSRQLRKPIMQKVKVGILGLGTVGSGTADVLARNASEITRRSGLKVDVIIASMRNLNRARGCSTDGIELTTDPFAVVDSPDVDIVVELIGGTDLAKDLVFKALDNGKHVVTANKALIALHGNEIFERAQEVGVSVAYEAAVAFEKALPAIKLKRLRVSLTERETLSSQK